MHLQKLYFLGGGPHSHKNYMYVMDLCSLVAYSNCHAIVSNKANNQLFI